MQAVKLCSLENVQKSKKIRSTKVTIFGLKVTSFVTEVTIFSRKVTILGSKVTIFVTKVTILGRELTIFGGKVKNLWYANSRHKMSLKQMSI